LSESSLPPWDRERHLSYRVCAMSIALFRSRKRGSLKERTRSFRTSQDYDVSTNIEHLDDTVSMRHWSLDDARSARDGRATVEARVHFIPFGLIVRPPFRAKVTGMIPGRGLRIPFTRRRSRRPRSSVGRTRRRPSPRLCGTRHDPARGRVPAHPSGAIGRARQILPEAGAVLSPTDHRHPPASPTFRAAEDRPPPVHSDRRAPLLSADAMPSLRQVGIGLDMRLIPIMQLVPIRCIRRLFSPPQSSPLGRPLPPQHRAGGRGCAWVVRKGSSAG
jgi:hypothetical protein